jgi:hypothetical protein
LLRSGRRMLPFERLAGFPLWHRITLDPGFLASPHVLLFESAALHSVTTLCRKAVEIRSECFFPACRPLIHSIQTQAHPGHISVTRYSPNVSALRPRVVYSRTCPTSTALGLCCRLMRRHQSQGLLDGSSSCSHARTLQAFRSPQGPCLRPLEASKDPAPEDRCGHAP